MPSICLTFQVHLPCHLKHYSFFEIGESAVYEGDVKSFEILDQAATHCFLPANRILLKQIRECQGDFRVAFSISGSVLDQFERFRPDVLDSFKELAGTGCVEFVNGPYHHSLASILSMQEFREQAVLHHDKLQSLFGQSPSTFQNTGMIYSDAIAREVESLGYQVILAGGVGKLLGKRSPNHVYRPTPCSTLKLLVNNPLFSKPDVPLDAWGKGKGEVVASSFNYPFDGGPSYESFLRFLNHIPGILPKKEVHFHTPTEAAHIHKSSSRLASPDWVSGTPPDNDLSPWMGNEMQKDALNALYLLEPQVKGHHDLSFLRTWRMLQTADHFFYMGTRPDAEGGDAPSATPYDSPYDAYINFMNVLTDFSERIEG